MQSLGQAFRTCAGRRIDFCNLKAQHVSNQLNQHFVRRDARMYTLFAYSQDPSVAVALATMTPKGDAGAALSIKTELPDGGTHDSEAFSASKYLRHLRTSRMGKTILYAPICPSTQTVMLEAYPALPSGTVVIADVQNSGKGRGSNVWESPRGQLAFSFKCSMGSPSQLIFVQYLVSLCVVKACHSVGGDAVKSSSNAVRMKWPNDIYANRLKIGGILCNSTYDMDRKLYNIVCGVGLNVNNRHPTTCLAELWALSMVSRERLLAEFMNHYEDAWERFQSDGFEPFLNNYLTHWMHSNEELTLEGDGGRSLVRVKGLTNDGFLLGVGADGTQYTLHPDQNSLDLFQGLIKKKLY